MISQSGISVNQDNTNMSTIQLTNNATAKHLKRISFFIFYHTCGGRIKPYTATNFRKTPPLKVYSMLLFYTYFVIK